MKVWGLLIAIKLKENGEVHYNMHFLELEKKNSQTIVF
jgi:hypothetical protein